MCGSQVTHNSQLMRLWTFVMGITLSSFFWFGGKKLAVLLMPKAQGQTDSDEKYKTMCEPANAILKTSRLMAGSFVLYLMLGGGASAMLTSQDPAKANVGMCMYLCSLYVCMTMLKFGILNYVKFGVRKTLKKGKEAGFGSATTTMSSASSVAPEG